MILIRNVKIVDGTGQPAYQADVLISDDRISAIGHFPNKKADQVIEGLGAYLTPGFIEIQSEADHYLKIFTDPGQQSYRQQGITTIVCGHGGASLAPLLYGSLKAIQKYTDINQVNVNWHSFDELLQELKKLPLGVNFGSLTGHSTIRRDLTSDIQRDLTDNEVKVFQEIIEQAMNQGALGLSTGLHTIHARATPFTEIKLLLTTVAKYGGLHSARLRNEKERLVDAVNELVNLYQSSGAKTIINRFLPRPGYQKQFDLAKKILEQAGDGLSFSLAPEGKETVPAYTLLPEWAQAGGLKEMTSQIKEPAYRQRLLTDLKKNDGAATIVEAPPAYKYLVGKSLKEFAENRGLKLNQGLLELMIITEMKVVLAVNSEVNQEQLAELALDDQALITGSPGKFLEIADKKRWPLERTIAKLTLLPAKVLGLAERGLVKENYFADLVLIKEDKIQKVLVNGGERGEILVG